MVARYAGPFVLLLSTPAFYCAFGAPASLATVGALLIWLLGAELVGGAREPLTRDNASSHYRLVPILYIPLQLGVLVWAATVASRPTVSVLGFAGLALSIGVLIGVFGMLAAHEMIHSPMRWLQALGGLMLTGMLYRHFRIAHIYGHHRWAGTERDAATARLDESFYSYLVRSLPQQVTQAFKFEERRLRKHTSAFLLNRVTQDAAVYLVVFAAIFALAGPRGAGFYIVESAVAITVLELFNYIAHYGLTRERLADGSYESFCDRHSWNSSNALANAMILNMGRHSDHHRHPRSSYEQLRQVRGSPELPAGYAGSILLALLPPLWRGVMDPAVLCVRAQMLEADGQDP